MAQEAVEGENDLNQVRRRFEEFRSARIRAFIGQ
jgi:hypothetical protein